MMEQRDGLAASALPQDVLAHIAPRLAARIKRCTEARGNTTADARRER